MGNFNKNEVANNLSAMIKIDTVENNGDLSKFYQFHQLLENLYPNLHKYSEKIEIEGSLLFKIKGKKQNLQPILIMSHHDVVDADEKWKYPPFEGVIEDGCVWGRGGVDTKGSLCAFLEATESLLKEGFIPECDLYLASSCNEETSNIGAKQTVEFLKEQGIKLSIVVDEGGAIVNAPLPGTNGYYAMLGILEKGYANVKFTAKSLGGHASTPTKNTPIARLSAFVNEVNNKSPFKCELTPPIKAMFKEMSTSMRQPYKFLFSNVNLFSPILKKVLPKFSPQANAMLATTCAFTMSSGSLAPNIIPDSAYVIANLRFMIHQPMKESLKIMEGIAKKYDISMEVLDGHDCSSVADINSDSYAYLCKCIKQVFPKVNISPYVMLASTDSRYYCDICDCVIRFAPLKLNSQQLDSPHGIDENISIDALVDACEFYRYFIQNYGK